MLDSIQSQPRSLSSPAGGSQRLAIRLEDVAVEAGSTPLLAHVSLTLSPPGPTVVIGPNGSGKTTLLRLAMGLVAPTAGSIRFEGAAAESRSRAFVFQKPTMLRRTAAANVAFALAAAGKPSAPPDVHRLLELAHIAPLADRPARRLSGGEQQRLALARALAREPRILLLDEPTASLDPAATRLVEEIIMRVSASGVMIVMSTHDLGQARRIARDVVLLAQGRVIEHASARQFFANPATEEARRFLAGDLII